MVWDQSEDQLFLDVVTLYVFIIAYFTEYRLFTICHLISTLYTANLESSIPREH